MKVMFWEESRVSINVEKKEELSLPINIEKKIEVWKNKLLDLGKRNRLIDCKMKCATLCGQK